MNSASLLKIYLKRWQKATEGFPEAKEETYKIPGTSATFNFKLPKNYFVSLDEKYDFSIFKINKYKNLSDTTYTSITIYTGRYPTFS